MSPHRVALSVSGVVQGVGFRPAVFRLASGLNLSGNVCNTFAGAQIEVEGPPLAVQQFVDALHRLPLPIRVEHVALSEQPATGSTRFSIGPSNTTAVANSESAQPHSALSLPLGADRALCATCLAEVRNPSDRRYGYPFTHCSECGPRYSITQKLPYERDNTALASFTRCSECQHEYTDAKDRRFHSQPIVCPRCGPRLRWSTFDASTPNHSSADALASALQILNGGGVVAALGLGGFQLWVNATDNQAVQRLRQRKHRPDKPFAVMFRDLEQLSAYCVLSPLECTTLASAHAPIVLLRPNPAGTQPALAQAVSPTCERVGALLPTTALHHLVAGALTYPLLCTSGNRSNEALCYTHAQAETALVDVADALLSHDRPVLRPLDDSVGHVVQGQFRLLRRARGYVPEALKLETRGDAPDFATVLALGGHLKNTFTLLNDHRAMVGPHLGDLETQSARANLEQTLNDWLRLFALQPDRVVCDQHEG